MSANNPQQKSVDIVLDKISKDIRTDVTNAGVVIPIALAAVTGLAAMTNRINNRIHELDKRVDEVELRVAENYVSKADLETMIDRVEGHLIRLENKLDKLTYR